MHDGITVEELTLAEFDFVEEAYPRFVEYARVTGFVVWKGDVGKDDEDKGCGKWKMKSFVMDHNHDLVSLTFTNVITPHHQMSDGD
ncbi:hypothetical protein AHAS_Ahas03G0186400 [Arachis hypogaea]